MPLLGQAAMLLSFDVAAEAIDEHDDWHTHEHLHERLSIPGFLRGTRWVATETQPRYFVLYEVDNLSTLTSPAYLERLNNPSPWTTKIMPSYRGMSRGLCSVSGSFGTGLGGASLLVRFTPVPDAKPSLRERLLKDVLPRLPSTPGLGSAHLLEGAATPSMTKEQSIRGADAPVDWAVLVIGYDEDALAELAGHELDPDRLRSLGGSQTVSSIFRLDYSLTEREAASAQDVED
jgi:hypothetical protein